MRLLKGGIETRNAAYNNLIELIEKVSFRSKDPILLEGETGVGKTLLAKRISALKQKRYQPGDEPPGDELPGDEPPRINCATLRDPTHAHSTLFGHVKGAFTGAVEARKGLLLEADKRVVFLDEVGELSLDIQAMLLKALDEKEFTPLGADHPVKSDFQLITGTNRDLNKEVREGRFREDLLARISTWRFWLPPLRERPEDIEPNLDHELKRSGRGVHLTPDARHEFLKEPSGNNISNL